MGCVECQGFGTKSSKSRSCVGVGRDYLLLISKIDGRETDSKKGCRKKYTRYISYKTYKAFVSVEAKKISSQMPSANNIEEEWKNLRVAFDKAATEENEERREI